MPRKAPSPMTDSEADRYPHVRASEFAYVSYCPQRLINKLFNLDVYEEIAYRRITDMILMSADTLMDDDKKLGYSTKLGKAKWLKVKASLMAQKLLYVEDGRITSLECQQQLERVEAQIMQKSIAGKASAESRGKKPKSLINNNTTQTAVGTAEPTAVVTNYELPNDDYYAGAREALENTQAKRDTSGLNGPRQVKPKDPDAVAIVQALTEVVISVFGETIGGDARKFPAASDIDFSLAFLKHGRDLDLSAEETIETMRSHFHSRCTKRKNDGVAAPRSVSFFNESAPDALSALARAKTKAAKGFASNGNGYRANFGNSQPQATVARAIWQDISSKFATSGKIKEARRINKVASEQGADEANQLARQMEAELSGNRRAA